MSRLTQWTVSPGNHLVESEASGPQVARSQARSGKPRILIEQFPDYSDADNYLTPFFVPGNFLKNHYENPAVTELVTKQLTTEDKDERENVLGEAQTAVASIPWARP